MYFFKHQKGAVSVFLTLVLIPVLVFSLLTVDAARIYSAKVVVSDSGEMALNGALTQYDDELFDRYGLLAMSNKPQSDAMLPELESLFVKSLNSQGISGVGDYESILTLLEKNFEAIGVANTEIYRTEVEKQQILEYMKYRAPVCLTELIIDKFKSIKDFKKVMEAVDRQMDYAESMEECHDAFEDAYNALKTLDTTLRSFPSEGVINSELGSSQNDYTGEMAKCFIMIASIQKQESSLEKPSNISINELMSKYVEHAKKVDLQNPLSQESYSNFLKAVYYEKGIRESKDEKPSNEEYEKAKSRLSGYIGQLRTKAYEIIREHHNNLAGYVQFANRGKTQAETAYKKLEIVREALLVARNRYEDWEDAANTLSDEQKGYMSEELRLNRYYFYRGENGREHIDNVDKLMSVVKIDKESFSEIERLLKEVSELGKSVATIDADSQYTTYISSAEQEVVRILEYREIDTIKDRTFKANYKSTTIDWGGCPRYSIESEPFFTMLKDYCEKNNGASSSKEDSDRANKGLKEGQKDSKTIADYKEMVDILKFNWSQQSNLPSVKLGLASFKDKSGSFTEFEQDTDITKKGSRGKAIKRIRESLQSAKDFLLGLESLLESGIEKLYIAEYAMRMFSHMNCDKKMNANKGLDDVDPETISGYKMATSPAYKSEIEYIIWGNQESYKNITSTLSILFGIRLIFNVIHTFTDKTLTTMTKDIAHVITAAAPYLEPIVTTIYRLGIAVKETCNDVKYLKDGYGVVIKKNEPTFETSWLFTKAYRTDAKGSVDNPITFDYGEYLRIILLVRLISGKQESKILARIGDCIQINTTTNLLDDYTMVQIDADIDVKTSFLRKVSDIMSANWERGDVYTFHYKSILGY